MKVALVSSAIKTHYWKEFYERLTQNEHDFHLVFVGHTNPSWTLPSNFTYIHSNLLPSACFEIAYRYAYDNIDADFIFHTADDLFFEPRALDDLISGYQKAEKDYPNRLLMVGAISEYENGESHRFNAWSRGPACFIGEMTTMETSKEIGGIDKRFNAVYWDIDRTYRCFELGGILVPLTDRVLFKEKKNEHGSLTRYRCDRMLLKDLWNVDEDTGPELYAWDTNKFFKRNFTFKRKEEVVKYTDDDLGYLSRL